MRYLLFFSLFIIASLVSAQDMSISFEDLKNKRVKSTPAVLVSDHTIDGRMLMKSGYWIEFSGNTTRGIVLKNFPCSAENPCRFTFRNVVNKRTDKGVTIKVGDYMQNFILDGTNTTSIKALAGGSADQIIYLEGKFLLNPTIQNFPDIDGGRPRDMKTTPGGAALQIKGWNTADCNGSNWNIGNVTVDGVHMTNINDEIFYFLHNTTVGNYTRGKKLLVRNSSGRTAGRDGGQAIAFDSVVFINCVFDDLGREQEPNHVSGFSLNAGNKHILIENCSVTNAPQFIYNGTEGTAGEAYVINSTYIQGTSPGARSNQALYLKADKTNNFKYILKGNTIIAPAVKIAAVTADRMPVYWDISNSFSAPALFRSPFNGGQYVEVPVINKTTVEVTEEKTSSGSKYYLNWNGQQILIKP